MSEHGNATLELHYQPDSSTPRAARRALASRFSSSPLLETLLLCVSEVVTNAVLHARTNLSIIVSERADTVRVEVTDGSRVKPVRRTFADISPTGRGLHLLDRLATCWGIDELDSGKTVWFELSPEAAR